MTVTYSRKRYVSVCVGCEKLFDTVRRDQLTCSPACRVKAHRNGALTKRRALASSFKTDPAGIGHAAAADLLRPDLAAKIMTGEVSYGDIMPDLCKEYDKLLWQAARDSV